MTDRQLTKDRPFKEQMREWRRQHPEWTPKAKPKKKPLAIDTSIRLGELWLDQHSRTLGK